MALSPPWALERCCSGTGPASWLYVPAQLWGISQTSACQEAIQEVTQGAEDSLEPKASQGLLTASDSSICFLLITGSSGLRDFENMVAWISSVYTLISF